MSTFWSEFIESEVQRAMDNVRALREEHTMCSDGSYTRIEMQGFITTQEINDMLERRRAGYIEVKEYPITVNNVTKALRIKTIYVNDKKKTTVVVFEDGTKEKVKLEEGGSFDVYNAVAICIAKRVYGSNSAFKKAIKDNVTYQMSKERRLSTERLRKNIQRAIDKMAKISR